MKIHLKLSALLSVLLLLCCLAVVSPLCLAFETILNNVSAEVCFSPQERCSDQIIRRLDTAKTEVLVQAFSFTSAPIKNALLAAKRRGVKVAVILDKGEQVRQGFRTARFLASHAIPVYIDDKHGSAHNKVMVIDAAVVITGSFNYTYAADDRNAENLLIIRSEGLARAYINNWSRHKDHSTRY